MGKYVFLYTGGKMAETAEAQQESMQAWGAWFGSLGSAVSDMGNQFGASATVAGTGVTSGGGSSLSGYTVVTADSLDDASSKAKGCPLLSDGGTVEVYEALEM
jgi:hypothetical protein